LILIQGSEDSEYESAAEASFVERSFVEPSVVVKVASNCDLEVDSLIDGLSSFQLITPCPRKEPMQFVFGSPEDNQQPQHDAAPEVI
jgi:hypothetical protein